MTLTIQDLGSLGEFFGSIAVLATLIYLALQTRQNTMAIAAQLDSATVAANQTNLLSAAASNDLAEAMREDLTADVTTNQLRRGFYWIAMFSSFQWQFKQARRGLLPSYDEAEMGAIAALYFTMFRSFSAHWETAMKPNLSAEFVEEQRSKAA